MSRTKTNKKSRTKNLVDICVLTTNRFDMLRKCLKSIDALTFKDYSVHVLYNGSDKKERILNNDLVERYNSKVLEQLVGFPLGANAAIKMGTSPLVLFVSDDIELFPDALDVLVRRMDDASISLCGLKLMFPPSSSDPHRPAGRVQHIGHAMNLRGDIIHPLVGWDADNPKCCVSQDVISVTGATFILRRDLFNKVGGFNPVYGRGTFEDTDLALKFKQLGFRIFIDTNAKAYHYVGATAEKDRNLAPNLTMNSMIFKSAWAQSGLFEWNDWKFW